MNPTKTAPDARRVRWIGAAFLVGQCLLLAALLFVYLRGWDRDFSVPFRFSRDSLSAGMLTKSTADNGWWWFNSSVGAPFGLDQRQYPANPNVDQVLVWIVSRVVSDSSTASNIAWLAMVMLSGLSATWCMGKVGASRASALVAGTLFALTPYALYRSTGHIWLVIYLVPFVCTAALLLASGRLNRWFWGKPFVGLLAGCALLAFNYIYYAFFGCFILVVASLTGFLQYRSRRLLGAGALCIALIGAGTIVNLVPNVLSWAERGRPLVVSQKTAAESEVYGLKIRQLVSPGLWHRFPPFRAWLAREEAAAYPLETENGSSRLGVVASFGFLALLALLLAPRIGEVLVERDILLAASRLTLAAVLLATVGGFGSLFNLLVTPEIRAYNRISPFITFFSLTAVALALDSLVKFRRWRVGAVLLIAFVGLADQRAAAVHLNAVHKGIQVEFVSLRSFVQVLESRLPAEAMVFQLPFRMYPDDDGGPRAQPYENLKPYLASRSLRWSYPALSNQQARWHQAAALLPLPRLARELGAQGFSAVLVDRGGYADNGAEAIAVLQEQLGQDSILSETPRYIAFDIRPLASDRNATSFLAKAASAGPVSATLPACTGETLVHIDRVGTSNAPFVTTPHVSQSTGFSLSGWAVDQASEASASGVDVLIDESLFQSIYGIDRGDVASALRSQAYQRSGFVAGVPASSFERGSHMLSLRVVSADGSCYYQTAPQTVVVD